MRRREWLAAVALFGVVFTSPGAYAGELAPAAREPARAEGPDGWEWELIPYLWALDIDGTITAKGVSIPMKLDFSDVLDAMDIGGSARLEVKKDRWGIFFDGTYLKLSQEIDDPSAPFDLRSALPGLSLKRPMIPGPMRPPAERRKLLLAILKRLPPAQRRRLLAALLGGPRAPRLRLPAIDEIDIEMTLAIVELGVSYRCFELPLNATESRVLTFEALAGGRYTYMKSEMDVDISPGTLGVLPGSVSIEESVDWIEPLVGGRVTVPLSDRFSVGVRGDVGGFGIGSGSQLTWQILAGLECQASDSVSIVAGYRFYDLEYEKGSGADKVELDAEIKGPMLGVRIRF
jgi:hypothetical protein